MELNALYNLVVMLILIGMVIGVGIVALDKFAAISGLSSTAVQAINNTITAIADIPKSWLSLIVTVTVLAIVIYLVIRGFAGYMGGGAR